MTGFLYRDPAQHRLIASIGRMRGFLTPTLPTLARHGYAPYNPAMLETSPSEATYKTHRGIGEAASLRQDVG